MEPWQVDFVAAIQTTGCESELFRVVSSLASNLGFDRCAYGLRSPLPIIRPKTLLLNNYPALWQARYQENNYIAVDPTVSCCLRSSQPVIWSDQLFGSALNFWEEARSFGLNYGWAQSSREAQGCLGMLTLARSKEPLKDGELRANGLKMSWLAQAAHHGMVRILKPKIIPETEVQLSQREICVLRWTADGKTSCDISEILNITERTVNFHISNAITKLNAANKTAATVRAALLGIL